MTARVPTLIDSPDLLDEQKPATKEVSAPAKPSSAGYGRAPSEDDFRWDPENEDIIVPEQSALAVYLNRWGQVVIREERSWDRDEDWYIRISRENLPSVITRLQALLAELG
jgi:hypothetical protein